MSVNESSPSSLLVDTVVPYMLRFGSVLVALVAIAGGLLYAKQDNLLYFPEIGGVPRKPADNPRGYRSPGEKGLRFDNCRIPCIDGVHIHAWMIWYHATDEAMNKSRPTIIFFHGNAGNIGLRLPNAHYMRQSLQCHVLMVEYRGYGDSDTSPIHEKGLRLDAEASLEYLLQEYKDQIDSTKIFVFGRSLGGAVGVHLAQYAQEKNLPLAGLIVENTFTSISDMVDVLLPMLSPIKGLVLKIGWNSKEVIPYLQLPILFLAGSADELVPPKQMQQLVQLAVRSRLVQVHIIQGGRHNESWMQGGTLYWQAIATFIQEAIKTTKNKGGTASTVSISSSTATDAAESSNAIPLMASNLMDIARDAAVGSSRASNKKD